MSIYDENENPWFTKDRSETASNRVARVVNETIGAGLTGSESAASGGYKRATITAGTGNVSFA